MTSVLIEVGMSRFPVFGFTDRPEKLPVIHNPDQLEIPVDSSTFQQILANVETGEEIHFAFLELIFVGEEAIVELNREHLNKEYVTDILTFRYDDRTDRKEMEASIYCCVPRIYEQAGELGTEIDSEFYRVFIHGLLHLAGYEDADETQKKEMRLIEEDYMP